MRKNLGLTFALLLGGIVGAQTKKELDLSAIRSMQGCYQVGFNFTETFQHLKDSTYKPSKDKITGALEWVEMIENSDNKVVLQHILLAGPGMVIKHWRQDWIYQNTELYTYDGDNKWNFVTKTPAQVQGQWTQKVYQVDDSPRYESSASWVHIDGKSFWESTAYAPLPRREYTQRADYNITIRGNRHEITETGWIHEQDNQKLLREVGQKDVLIASEKGLNTYQKLPDNRCDKAHNWWVKNHKMWDLVRAEWDRLFQNNANLKLAKRVNGKRLWEKLKPLEKETDQEDLVEGIREILKAFVK